MASGGAWASTGAAGRRFAAALAQGGEFAFVLSTAALAAGVVGSRFAGLFNIVVTITMLATPLILLAEAGISARFLKSPAQPQGRFDDMPEEAWAISSSPVSAASARSSPAC